ncbi:ionotropic receptor 93a isoform X1 [Rhopalosiphum maidis]|uniref:ionotropic receptor 93a isoform X1 n=1 Tax=Rhopalosiphum maidis TaxID=43146 RepID=UPI000EFE57CE|nr:ionotropic receptor 93a isoform X1 [Rhopalosiphum maidis]
MALTNTLLLALCANWPPPNNTETTLAPPWKWISEHKAKYINSREYQCDLKNNFQIQYEILRGKRLKIATFPNSKPLSWVTKEINGTLIGHGIAFEIVETLRQRYGFTYDVVIPTRETLLNENGSIIYMLVNGEVDMAAAFIPVLPGLDDIVKWGIELTQFQYVVLMKRPKESATGSGLLAPFEIEVWLLILMSLIAVGPIIYGIMMLRHKLCGHDSGVYSIPTCIWFVYGALMKQGSSLNPDTDSARLIFATWWIFIMILTSFYTANLTAFLTLSKFTLPIKRIEDIASNEYRWISSEGSAVEYIVKVDNDLKPLRQSMFEGNGQFMVINIDEINTILNYISSGTLLLHDKNWLNFLMLHIERSITDDKERCRYVLTTDPYLTRSMSFVYPKHSILPPLFNPIMLSYMESGIVRHLQTKDLPEAVICPLNLGSKERQLRNSDLYTTYAVVVCGFSMAAAVFTLELLSRRTGWFASADLARRSHDSHGGMVRCEIAVFGKPSKTIYPFSHRDNVMNAASATHFVFQKSSSSSSSSPFVVNTRGMGTTIASDSSSPSPFLWLKGKSSLRRFQY